MSTENPDASALETTGAAPGGTGTTDPEPPRAQPEGDAAWRRARLKVVGLVALLIFVYLIPDIFYTVSSGETAVVWYLFAGGTDVEDVRGEGLRVKWPWDRAYVYDIRLRQETRTFPVLSNDGLPLEVESSIRFRLHREALGKLHKNVGPDYVERLVVPEFGAEMRKQIARYRPEDLYTEQRAAIQERVRSTLADALRLDYEVGRDEEVAIHVEDVLIRNILLPPKVAAAIEDKLAQEQRMLEYDYRLLKEEKERQRKQIEAQGIRLFQDIVAEGISERYLKWKGIDATLALAQSPNAKIVVIGAGEDGRPSILGGLDALPAATGPPTQPTP